MSKLMNQEGRNQQIQDLMVSIRRNTEGSKCIDVFEILLNEIEDKNVVDVALADMHRFVGEFLRLGRDVDNMKNVDFIAKILTYDFLQPARFFNESRKLAQMYLSMNDILEGMYQNPVYDVEKKIVLPNVNSLGNVSHKDSYKPKEVVAVTKYCGDLFDLSSDEVREKKELARKVVLLYNYMPAVVKAFFQTKRRGFDLDRNSTKFGK